MNIKLPSEKNGWKSKQTDKWNKLRRGKRSNVDAWFVIASLVAFFGALIYFHYSVVDPMLEAMIPTAYAGEPCDDPDRYINAKEAREWCYE